ncbi:MAG: dihydropteroate synthase [Nitrospira sp.]|nr:dihydropteroate synthase [Nitrospira sp.]
MDHALSQPLPSQNWFLAKGRKLHWKSRPLIMGVVNITPDSFYDGGRYDLPERAIAHALELVEQGADIIDIGGESTRPGAVAVSEHDELGRVIPVLEGLVRHVSVPISIDTTKSRVARLALDTGASIINDVSALRQDPDMANVIAQSGAAVVLMHMQGTPQTMQQSPQYADVGAEVVQFFEERVETALLAGIARTNIILDPGFGFGKLLSHNLALLRGLSSFTMLNCPLLVGLSRKGFIGTIVGKAVDRREWGTAAAVALAVDRGAKIVRVHDVAMMIDVVKMAAALSPLWATYEQEHDA